MIPTSEIRPATEWPMARTWEETKRTSGSAAGYHAVSEWMTCPEKSRLRKLGVTPLLNWDLADGMNERDFGTLIHELRAIRIVYGHEWVMATLDRWRAEIGDTAYARAALIFATYEQVVPRTSDPFEYLGVECEVVTHIGNGILRTVRYDTVVYAQTASGAKELFSFECKTAARSGEGTLRPYYPQAMVQMALWNSNAALVEKYGEMKGVIFDLIVKTKMPSIDRIPRAFSGRQQVMTLDYLRLPENGGASYSVQPDGSFPRMLHSCWGRWHPCEYIDLCHEGACGSYEMRGTPLMPSMIYKPT